MHGLAKHPFLLYLCHFLRGCCQGMWFERMYKNVCQTIVVLQPAPSNGTATFMPGKKTNIHTYLAIGDDGNDDEYNDDDDKKLFFLSLSLLHSLPSALLALLTILQVQRKTLYSSCMETGRGLLHQTQSRFLLQQRRLRKTCFSLEHTCILTLSLG